MKIPYLMDSLFFPRGHFLLKPDCFFLFFSFLFFSFNLFATNLSFTSQSTKQSSSRKLKNKERNFFNKNKTGDHSWEILRNSKPSFVQNNGPHAQNNVHFSHYPLDTKHSKRNETQHIHGIFKAKGKRKKKYE